MVRLCGMPTAISDRYIFSQKKVSSKQVHVRVWTGPDAKLSRINVFFFLSFEQTDSRLSAAS